MTKGTIAKQVSLLTLATLLAACGGAGGGVNGTPTPTAGGGGGGGTGGAGGGSTPTPSPSPTPAGPPTGGNARLSGALVSETFQNDATSASASYTANGLASAGAGAGSMGIVYDATRDVYVLSSGSRSESFARADIVSTLTNQTTTAYLKQNGQTADLLTIYRPTVVAERSVTNAFTVQTEYVAGAVWQRTTTSGSQISGSLDSGAFGVVTPSGSVPRTGSARFEVALLGASALKADLASFVGSGTLNANFTNGNLSGGGNVTYYNPTTGAVRWFSPWDVNATIKGDVNSFSGNINIGQAAGTVVGRFYGPQSIEIGASFAVTGAGEIYGATGAGVLLGRRWVSNDLNNSIVDIKFDQNFAMISSTLQYPILINTGSIVPGVQPRRSDSQSGLSYYVDTATFAVQTGVDTPINYQLADRLPDSAEKNFYTYQRAADPDARIAIYKAGSANRELQLTYSSFFYKESGYVRSSNPNTKDVNAQWSVIGLATPERDVPRTGASSYIGKIYGVSYGYKSDTTDLGSLTGNAKINFNFSEGKFVANLAPVASLGGQTYNLGPVEYSGMLGLVSYVTDYGFFAYGINNDRIEGRFFGPKGDEVGARFEGGTNAPGFVGGIGFSGVFAAKRQ